jgi:microcystin-dependent protein
MTSPFIGEIKMTGHTFAPKFYAFCNGQILPIASNVALFSLLGTTYGGNGTTTFALPNLQGRIPVGQGQGPGLANYVLGQQGGEVNHTLTTSEMAAHPHAGAAVSAAGTARDPRGNLWAGSTQNRFSTGAPNTTMHPTAIGGAGSSFPHNNTAPYLAVTYIIATQGIFPSRN